MEQLWSPWRQEYIDQSSAQGDGEDECFLCEDQHKEDDEVHVLQRSNRAYVLLNAYPYNPGHVLIAPYRHKANVEDLNWAEMEDFSRLLQRTVSLLKEALTPDGLNLGMNLGRVAGAGVEHHVHWHVVPRWNGDTNFMPVVGQTKVLSELVAQTYDKLKPLF